MKNDQLNWKRYLGSQQQVQLGFFCLFILISLLGCETTKGPAPVVERTVMPKITKSISDEKQTDRNRYYTVQKGDTFYSIALNHGIDQKNLAEWNNITDPSAIKPGQRINLSVPSENAEPALFALPQHSGTSTGDPAAFKLPEYAADHADIAQQKIKTYPKALKLSYSEQNVARLQYSVNPALNSGSQPGDSSVSASGTRIEDARMLDDQPSNESAEASSKVDWIWPTTGNLISSFSSNLKGVKISGHAGQSIVATADGEVVYSGDGLRGYGNLIIIKHDEAILSAYAHNSKLLVKEGETVIQGQKIAEMGNSDTDTPQLHFEIRRFGKPVDPMKFLPADSD